MMKTKLLTVAGAMLLLATAIITPTVVGHDDLFLCPNPPLVKGPCDPPGPNHRYPDSYDRAPHVEAGVAGRYVGAWGPSYAPDAYTFPNNALSNSYLMGYNPWWCDFEVYIDEDRSLGSEHNEEVIDGQRTWAGWVPDGTWDDGGQGGACHRNYYYTMKFNTAGCPGGRSARGVNALDGDIFIAAACDWKTVWEGPGSFDGVVHCLSNDPIRPFGVLLSPSLSGVNELLFEVAELPDPPTWWPSIPASPDVAGFSQAVAPFRECPQRFIDCQTDLACFPEYHEYCGSDGAPDAVDFGFGSGLFGAIATFPGGPFGTLTVQPAPPDPPISCDDQFEMSESIYVFDTVASNTGFYVDPDGPGGLDFIWVPSGQPDIYPALTGQVWTVTGGDPVPPYVPWTEPLLCTATVTWAAGAPVGASSGGTCVGGNPAVCDPEAVLVAFGPVVVECIVDDGCDGRPVEATAALISGVAGDWVSSELFCDPMGSVTGMAFAGGPAPSTDRTGKFYKPTEGDYRCVMVFNVAAAGYVGTASCHDEP